MNTPRTRPAFWMTLTALSFAVSAAAWACDGDVSASAQQADPTVSGDVVLTNDGLPAESPTLVSAPASSAMHHVGGLNHRE